MTYTKTTIRMTSSYGEQIPTRPRMKMTWKDVPVQSSDDPGLMAGLGVRMMPMV